MDEDDKIRRNLVIFSSAILVSAVLDLPISALLTHFASTSYASPDGQKIWGIGLTILAYLAIRYRFSSEGEKYISERQRDMDSLHWSYLVELLKAQLDSYTKSGNEPRIFKGKLVEYVNSKTEEMLLRHTDLTKVPRPKLTPNIDERQGSEWEYSVRLQMNWQSSQIQSNAAGFSIDMLVDGREKIVMQIKTWCHCILYSRTSIVYLAPIFFGLVASLTLCWRLFQLYLAA